MTVKEIQDLLKLVNRLDLAEFKMKDGEFEMQIRTAAYSKAPKTQVLPQAMAPTQVVASAVQPLAPAQAPATPPADEVAAAPEKADDEDKLVAVKSPIVGTFYRSSGPDKAPYIKVGDTISVGDVVCIVEAMKLFNEIESEVSGKIVQVMVEDAQPVEYDQVLFLVDPA